MSIIYDRKKQIFLLKTKHTAYAIGIFHGYLVHLHYGGPISIQGIEGIEDILAYSGRSFSPNKGDDDSVSDDTLPMEYPVYGSGDFRNPAFHAVYSDGSHTTQLSYEGYSIKKGKIPLTALPSTLDDDSVTTLEITLKDEIGGVRIVLRYGVYEAYDIICRSAIIENCGGDPIQLLHAMSMSMDMVKEEYDFIHLSGGYARERHIHRAPIGSDMCCIDSKRGASSHYHNPFFAVAHKSTTENQGEVYGFNLLYSGNFISGIETDAFCSRRIFTGINPFAFCWCLEAGDCFETPEAVMVYTKNGIGHMSRLFHRFIEDKICRGNFVKSHRPVLINNWEATYFNFDEKKILEIVKSVRDTGIELMVLDDGWFGKRDDDCSSLGDWTPDPRKLPDGVKGLCEKVNHEGMQFGIWVEPEMISYDSALYRVHPEWCIHVKNREKSVSRWQYVLDLSRMDVCEYIIESLSTVFSSANISYVKWDMNRNITEAGSAQLSKEHMGEIFHRYMLGLYRIMDTLTKKFPHILFEGCSGGGGRFDLGILAYFPQIWTSDDTDAIERIYIQHGTSIAYPFSVMCCHVSDIPNHQVHRMTSMKLRGHVALPGCFGYELDPTKMTEADKEAMIKQIRLYRQIEPIVHFGELYRIASPFEGQEACWQFSKGKDTIVFIFTIKADANAPFRFIRLQELDEKAKYREKYSEKIYGGDVLMEAGIWHQNDCDGKSRILWFEKI